MITVTYYRNRSVMTLHYAMSLKDLITRLHHDPGDYPFLVDEVMKVEVR